MGSTVLSWESCWHLRPNRTQKQLIVVPVGLGKTKMNKHIIFHIFLSKIGLFSDASNRH